MAITKCWLGGWLLTIHLGLLKNAVEFSISNRMSSFRSFFDKSFYTKCRRLKNTLGLYRSLLGQLYEAACDYLMATHMHLNFNAYSFKMYQGIHSLASKKWKHFQNGSIGFLSNKKMLGFTKTPKPKVLWK